MELLKTLFQMYVVDSKQFLKGVFPLEEQDSFLLESGFKSLKSGCSFHEEPMNKKKNSFFVHALQHQKA